MNFIIIDMCRRLMYVQVKDDEYLMGFRYRRLNVMFVSHFPLEMNATCNMIKHNRMYCVRI